MHDGKLDVTIEWAPQRTVDWALVVSAVAIVGCLVLALWPVGRRRRRRHDPVATTAGDDVSSPDGAPLATVALDERPTLQLPFTSEGPRTSVPVSVLTGLVAGAVAAAVATPRAGLAVAAGTVLVLLVPRLRFLLGIAAVGCVAAAGIYVAVHQGQSHAPDNGAWPQAFGTASQWAWAGVVFLGADGAVDVALRARRRRLDRRGAGADGAAVASVPPGGDRPGAG